MMMNRQEYIEALMKLAAHTRDFSRVRLHAMNTDRIYRNKLSQKKIIEEIEKNKGKQFDPKIADVFMKLLKDGKI